MGTLVPHDGKPNFSQLYIHDTDCEIENRIKALCQEDDFDGELDRTIFAELIM